MNPRQFSQFQKWKFVSASIGAIIIAAVCNSCARQKPPLEVFMDQQRDHIVERSTYNQADFIFWGALYEPTTDDINAMRSAWNDHAKAFPESKPLLEIEASLRRAGTRSVLVALFMSEYEKADLKNKSLGWSVYPVPADVQELSENDLVLRTLFPVKNPWARYFLLRYSSPVWNETSQMVIGNRDTKIELSRPSQSMRN